MRRRSLRWWTYLATVFGGATMFQSVGFTATNGIDFGCNRFISNGILSGTDFSFLLDFDNGFAGGLFQPCNDPSSGAIFLDCSNFVPTDTGGGIDTGVNNTGANNGQAGGASLGGFGGFGGGL